MFDTATLQDTRNATSSLGSAAGPTLFDSLDGPTIAPSGLEAVHVSRFRRRGNKKAKPTSGTSGLCSFDLSTPSGRIAFSVSKSLKPSDTVGGMIYAMTWKESVTPRGRVIYRLAASARQQSVNDCSGQLAGFPTCKSSDGEKGVRSSRRAEKELERKGPGCDLPTIAAAIAGYPAPKAQEDNRTLEQYQKANLKIGKNAITSLSVLAGYCSPMAQDGSRGGMPPRPHDTGIPLSQQAAMVVPGGWARPAARDYKDTPGMATKGRNPDGTTRTRCDQLPRQAATALIHAAGLTSSTAKRGRLNPALSAWLMGYPSAWLMAAPDAKRKAARESSKASATPSSRRLPRSSSRRGKK